MADSDSKLDKLKQSLYRRIGRPGQSRGWSRFTSTEHHTPEDWTHEHPRPSENAPVQQPRSGISLPVKFFIFSAIFFVIALGIAAFVIVRGTNVVSSENIDISVSGPVLVAGGDPFTLQVAVVNRNSAPLEQVDLLVEFPEGARDPDAPSEELTHTRETLGDIESGERVSHTISAMLFGEEDVRKEIVVGIEYRVAGSNAIFFKDKSFDIQIGQTPLGVLIDMPTEVNSGDEITLSIDVVSNSAETLENVALNVEYPFGFSFSDSSPEPSVGSTLWHLGNLEPHGRRTIRITGVIEGQDNEERTFRFNAGLAEGAGTQDIATTLLIAKRSLTISRPFVQVDLTLDNSADEVHVVPPNRPVSATVLWSNNLPIPVEDVVIEATLSGSVLDESSVQVLNGFYRSIDNTIIWDKTRVPVLARLDPGARGQFTFEFLGQDPRKTFFKNGELTLTVTISGQRVGDTAATTGEVSSSVSKKVQFASLVDLKGQVVYSTGPFENTGPIPPEAEKETTYTITWSVTNTSNDLLGATVSAALPDYVSWVGAVSPASEVVHFNPVGAEVRWDLGSVALGKGYQTAPREVSFQVSILPSISQVGSSPTVIGEATLSAQDVFTGVTLHDVEQALTTAIVSDPIYRFGSGDVTQ